jgi:hypothetical protein
MKAAVYVLQLMEDEHDRLVNAQMRVQSAKMNEKRVRFQEMTAEEKREYAVALEAKKAVAIEAKKERDALKEKIDEARRQRNEARKQREEEARQREIEWALQKQKEAAAAEAEQRRIEAAWEAMRQASIRNEELIKDIKALKHSKTVCEIVKKHGMRLGDDPERLSSDFILGQIEETIRDKHKK